MAIMPITAEALARAGANLEIRADSNFMPVTIDALVKIVVEKGTHITIEAGNYMPITLQGWADLGRGHVTIRI